MCVLGKVEDILGFGVNSKVVVMAFALPMPSSDLKNMEFRVVVGVVEAIWDTVTVVYVGR